MQVNVLLVLQVHDNSLFESVLVNHFGKIFLLDIYFFLNKTEIEAKVMFSWL